MLKKIIIYCDYALGDTRVNVTDI